MSHQITAATNTTILHWPDELLQHLRQITRELQFNWNAVGQQMQLYIDNNPQYTDIQISATICRQRFAFDYTAITNSSNEVIKQDDSEVKPSEASLNHSKAASIESIKNYESMSLEDLIAHVDSTEIKMKQQKEDIFKRVMTSLSSTSQHEHGDNQLKPVLSDNIDEDVANIRKVYEESMLSKELEKQKRLDQLFVLNEKQRIDNEREILRKRFDRDSVDNEGFDPLSNTNASSSNMIEQDDDMLKDDNKEKYLIASYENTTTTTITRANEVIVQGPLGSLSTSYLESDEFEAILTELERDIYAKAVSKDEGGYYYHSINIHAMIFKYNNTIKLFFQLKKNLLNFQRYLGIVDMHIYNAIYNTYL